MKPEFNGPAGYSEHAHAASIAGQQRESASALTAAEAFDHNSAELLLRNPAVFVDRLTPAEFHNLDDEVKNGFMHLSKVVTEQLGLEPDTQRHTGESAEEYDYRVGVISVIHGLQRMVYMGPDTEQGYDSSKEQVVKEAVFLSSELFARGIEGAVTQKNPTIIETLRYFEGNSSAVHKRIQGLGGQVIKRTFEI